MASQLVGIGDSFSFSSFVCGHLVYVRWIPRSGEIFVVQREINNEHDHLYVKDGEVVL